MSHRSTGPACGTNPHHRMSDGDRQAVDSFRAYLATLARLRTTVHRLDRIRDAARLHRQQLLSTRELYAVIEADDEPAARARQDGPRCTCQYIAESWIQMDHADDCPAAAGARQDGAQQP